MTEGKTLWEIFDDEPLAELPYAGTSGWSGSETSKARAATDDASGRTKRRQQETLASLAQAGDLGLTYKELGEIHGWHHGQSSGALSVLHKTGHINRLTEKRNRCKVYVLPQHANDRTIEPYGGNLPTRVTNPREVVMLSEQQADVLIGGHDLLVNQVSRVLGDDTPVDSKEQAERAIQAVAEWLTSYRPFEFGDDYCSPLDVTAFILRKGEMHD